MEFLTTLAFRGSCKTTIYFNLATVLTTPKDVYILEENLERDNGYGRLDRFERKLKEEFKSYVEVGYFNRTNINKDGNVVYGLKLSIETKGFPITPKYHKEITQRVIKYLSTYETY